MHSRKLLLLYVGVDISRPVQHNGIEENLVIYQNKNFQNTWDAIQHYI